MAPGNRLVAFLARRASRLPRRSGLALLLAATLLSTGIAAAQPDAPTPVPVAVQASVQSGEVTLEIPNAGIGLGGIVRRSSATPVLITIDHHGSQPRKVRCTWELVDFDGESAAWERVVTLTPSRKQQVWLYAVPRIVKKESHEIWRFQVIDAATDRLLASQSIEPFAGAATSDRLVQSDERVVAIVGTVLRGLDIYTLAPTQHEKARFISGLELKSIPDRWQGLALVQTIIWSPNGGDPGSPDLSPDSAEALRQWVRRGGHLIVSLPVFADPWPASPLRDLLPPVAPTTLHDLPTPLWLGSPQERLKIDAKALLPTGKATVVLSAEYRPPDPGEGEGEASDAAKPLPNLGIAAAAGRQEVPIVVTHQFGMGRVTLIGIDLTDRRLARMNLPNGDQFWNTILRWRAPALRQQYVDEEQAAGRMAQPRDRHTAEIDQALIPPLVSMAEAAGGPLAIAIIFFGIYWLAAGPGGYGLAKARGISRHTWLLFVAVVAVFSVVAWSGAAMLRQRTAGIAHLTVLDIDGGTGLVRAHSWLSLFVPAHGKIEVAVDPSRTEESSSLLAAPGLPGGEESAFIDPERYTVPAVSPGKVRFPFRATAKPLEINFLGYLLEEEKFLGAKWGLPRGKLRIENGWPRGKLVHNLPGTLRDVIAIYTNGRTEPMVWKIGSWAPEKDLEIKQPAEADFLCVPAKYASDPSDPKKQKLSYVPPKGLLGDLSHVLKPGLEATATLGVRAPDDRIIQLIEMLSFYSNLPPPYYAFNDRTEIYKADPYGCVRTVGRELDLTPLLALPRLILIGHLDKGPFPIPLSVDGRTVAAEGWTTVRWIGPLD
ncbi:MAG: hypothetical protein NTW19_00285 [Planctomycetota bacterium]|nr:hypothetical protein [Planctomycetota bacterium]